MIGRESTSRRPGRVRLLHALHAIWTVGENGPGSGGARVLPALHVFGEDATKLASVAEQASGEELGDHPLALDAAPTRGPVGNGGAGAEAVLDLLVVGEESLVEAADSLEARPGHEERDAEHAAHRVRRTPLATDTQPGPRQTDERYPHALAA